MQKITVRKDSASLVERAGHGQWKDITEKTLPNS